MTLKVKAHTHTGMPLEKTSILTGILADCLMISHLLRIVAHTEVNPGQSYYSPGLFLPSLNMDIRGGFTSLKHHVCSPFFFYFSFICIYILLQRKVLSCEAKITKDLTQAAKTSRQFIEREKKKTKISHGVTRPQRKMTSSLKVIYWAKFADVVFLSVSRACEDFLSLFWVLCCCCCR